MGDILVGDLIEAHPIANRYGHRSLFRGIVTHVSDWEGKATYSAVGIEAEGGQRIHLQNYTAGDGDDRVDLIAEATTSEARGLAEKLDRSATSDRERRRWEEIRDLVTLRRLRGAHLTDLEAVAIVDDGGPWLHLGVWLFDEETDESEELLTITGSAVEGIDLGYHIRRAGVRAEHADIQREADEARTNEEEATNA